MFALKVKSNFFSFFFKKLYKRKKRDFCFEKFFSFSKEAECIGSFAQQNSSVLYSPVQQYKSNLQSEGVMSCPYGSSFFAGLFFSLWCDSDTWRLLSSRILMGKMGLSDALSPSFVSYYDDSFVLYSGSLDQMQILAHGRYIFGRYTFGCCILDISSSES